MQDIDNIPKYKSIITIYHQYIVHSWVKSYPLCSVMPLVEKSGANHTPFTLIIEIHASIVR